MKGKSLRERIIAMLCTVLMIMSVIPMDSFAMEETQTGLYGLEDEIEMNMDENSDVSIEVIRGTWISADADIAWQSSDETVATVTVDPSDSAKATVVALKAGKATITASANIIDDTIVVTDECEVTVKSAATDVIAKLAGELDPSNILTTLENFELEAELTPVEEYCTDSTVTWSITEGASYVTLSDNQVTIGELPNTQNEVQVVFQVKTSNNLVDDVTVTLKKADSVVAVDDLEIVYGDEGKMLSASVNGVQNSNVEFEQVEGGDVATVDPTSGEVTILKAGTFKVRATYTGDGKYANAVSETKELIVKPKTLQLEVIDNNVEITKESDGTNTLTDANKLTIRSLIKIADNQLVSTDTVDLNIDFPNTVVYSSTNPFLSNTVNLSNVVVTMNPQNNNYELDASVVTNTILPASITGKVPDTDSVDMTSANADVNLDFKGVILKAGEQGADDKYWYNADGISVAILDNDTQLIDSEGHSAVTSDGFLKISSDEDFYIKKGETYYGTYAVTYRKDSVAPTITAVSAKVGDKNVDGIVFDKEVVYTVSVTDADSGMKKVTDGCIQYGIANENNVGKVETWYTPDSVSKDGDTYYFNVSVEKNGYLFVKAIDCVGNSSWEEIRSIVLESQKPSITVEVDNTNYNQKHTITINTKDADDEGTFPYNYSGIKKIVYELKQGDVLVYSAEKKSDITPENISDIPNVRVLNDTIKDLQKGNCGNYVNKLLDGEYTLTATVYDNCGNPESSSCTLYFDNTAPNYTISMSYGRTDINGEYCYRADNCDLIVNVTDNRAVDGLEYEINVGTYQKTGSLTSNGNVNIESAEVKKLVDGTIPVTVTVTDAAGNSITKYAETNGINGLNGTENRDSASFVLDKTAPNYTISMSDGRTDTNGKYYYRADNCGLTVDVTDNYAVGGLEYEINVGTYQNSGTLTSNGDVNIESAEVNKLADGTIPVTVTVTDAAGNSITKYAETNGINGLNGTENRESASFVLDKTAPNYTISMSDGRTDINGKYYYRADNCDLTVNVKDNYAVGGLEYEINVGTYQKTGTLTSNGDVNIESAEVNKLADGTIPVTVTVTDTAGNSITKYAETNGINGLNGTENRESALFVLDKTAPKVTAVTTNAPESAKIKKVADAKGPYDEKDFYYNDKNLKVTFDILEENEADNLWYASVKKDGTSVNCSNVNGNQVQFDLSAEGKYTEFTVYGQDIAGNPLEIADNLTLSNASADVISVEGNTPGQNGVVSMEKNKIVDHTAPVAFILYTQAETDHMYTDVANYDAAAYYNTDINASITVTDKYGETPVVLDASKLYFGNTGIFVQAGSNSSDTTAMKSYTWNTDGEYYVGAYGTDRAGNALIVKEQIPNEPEQYVIQENSSRYLLIRDTVNPTYILNISPSDNVTNKDKQVEQENRYYFNNEFEATVTIEESNYDSERIYIRRVLKDAEDQVDSRTIVLEDFSGPSSKFIAEAEYNSETNIGKYVDKVLSGDGIYRYRIYGTDRAGNSVIPSPENDDNTMNLTGETQTLTGADFVAVNQQDGETEADLSVHVVLDTKRPIIDVNVIEDKEGGVTFHTAELTNEGTYETSLNRPYRSVSKATANINSTDFSPTKLEYAFETSNSQAENNNEEFIVDIFEKSNFQVATFDGQQRIRITKLQATDLAGNKNAATVNKGAVTTWMYLDVEPTIYDELAPTVTMRISGNKTGKAKGSVYGPDGNDLYTSDVTAEVRIEDPNEVIKSSGLYKVYYKVLVNGDDWTDKGLVDVSSSTDSGVVADKKNGEISYKTVGSNVDVTENETITYKDNLIFTFKTEDFNYNDVKLTVWAEDNAGNVVAESSRVSKGFGIDVTRPTIKVTYDNNEAEHDYYFKDNRTATVEVTERNFDAENTFIDAQGESSISGWRHTVGNAANGDEDIWSCTVTWDTDGDFSFDVDTKDLAGNKMIDGVDYADSVAPQKFTIDKTAPIIKISFDNEDVRNEKYFNAFRTATIEIEEHNFAGEDAQITVIANIAEGSVSTPSNTEWSRNNDRNITTVPFREDGDYSMKVEYIDLAGNEAEIETVDEFTVDTTVPVLEIGGVENNSANQGDVSPSITYHDINYDASMTSVSIVGYKNKDGKNLNGTAQENAFGGSFVCKNIEVIPENDDVYLCVGHVEDLAGNISEAELRFSVNRFGSNYILNDATEKLVEKYYVNEEPTIHITEINVNTLEFQEITATLNGEIMELKEGTDYQVEEVGNEGTWKEYHYTISSAYFKEDGGYNITVHSRDAAKNENSNRTAQIAENSKPIDFVLDKTDPETVITGVENGGQYVEDSRMVTLFAEDNIQLKELKLYLDDELVATYDEEMLKETAGTVSYNAESKNDWQTLKVVTKDKADNKTEQEVQFLLTSNLWTQYTHNTPLVVGSVVGVSGLGILAALWRRRKLLQVGGM